MNNKIVIFIYTSLPGYMYSCIEQLAVSSEYKIILVETSRNKNYPLKYKSSNYQVLPYNEFLSTYSNLNPSDIKAVFITGWANLKILKTAFQCFRKKQKCYLLSDQSKKNSIRQKLGRLLLKKYFTFFKKIVVPGKSAMDLMLYYGVDNSKMLTGLYTSNNIIFNQAYKTRSENNSYPKTFLFDGQFIDRKGFKFLISEYSEYRKRSTNPWQLTMVGKGPLEKIIPAFVNNLGFVHQDQLKDIYASAGCFVLPSYEDHWPLVIHQAASAGLPLLISPYCGNHYEFFKQNENGIFIDPHKKGSLVDAMTRIEKLSIEELKKMGNISYKLSLSYSVEKWVQNFIKIIEG